MSHSTRADNIATAETTDVRPATAGFYPIWENTGYIENHTEAYVGTNGAHYGVLGAAQVGVQPINFIYRSPNAYAKFRLLGSDGGFVGPGWSAALQVGAFYLMNEASRATFSPMYTSRLDNPDFSVLLLPVSLSATRSVGRWLELHQTASVLTVHAPQGELRTTAYAGYSAVAELKARARHSVCLHAGEVGFWDHDFSMIGTSYRYHNTWMEFRFGYFYRLRSEGAQSAPLIGLGFLL